MTLRSPSDATAQFRGVLYVDVFGWLPLEVGGTAAEDVPGTNSLKAIVET